MAALSHEFWQNQCSAPDAERAALLARFMEQGLPSRKTETWKFSDLARVLRNPPALAKTGTPPADLLSAIEAKRFCFSNGHLTSGETAEKDSAYRLAFSTPKTIPASDDAAMLLVAACAQSGTEIEIAAGKQPALPFLVLANADGASAYLHHRWHLGAGAKAIMLECCSADEAGALHTRADITLEAGAEFFHLRLVVGEGVHIASLQLDADKNACYQGAVLAVDSGKFARIQSFMNLVGEGAEARLACALLGSGNRHADITTHIRHLAPASKSIVFARSVLDDSANGVFQARADIAPQAGGSEAMQESKAMLLAPSASMQAKPELRIETDDVQCTHGAASGAPDEEALFFLRQRGFSPTAAAAMLAEAFVATALDKFPEVAGRDACTNLAQQWLGRQKQGVAV